MAKKALASEGIFSTVVSIDPKITKNGCSYGISFRCGERDRVRSILKSRGITYDEIMGLSD